MLREDFEHLVSQLEAIEKRHPQWYRWRLVLLIGLGYLYLVGVICWQRVMPQAYNGSIGPCSAIRASRSPVWH